MYPLLENSPYPPAAGVYIHIPFCVHKCNYCDFYSITKLDKIPHFIQTLLQEIELFAKNKDYRKIEADSIFIGGGTPSLLEPQYIELILKSLNTIFDFSVDTEFTIEANPGATENKYLSEYKQLGINRLSFGVQSFNDDELKFLERIHTAKEAQNTIETAINQGFDNISLDLIFGLPNQTMEKWANTLQTALSYNLHHYSIYNLIYEEGTRLTKDLNSSKINALPEDMEEEIYNYTVQEMQNKNYKQYEISNYNKENYFSRHNIKYWTHQEYYGFGPSSHSFDGKKRYWNFSNLNKYSENIYKNQLPIEDIDELDNDKIIRETIMLGLRFGGVPILPLKDIYQVDLLDLISNNENLFKRHLEPNINKLIISPSSKFIANEIVINLIKYIELKIFK